MGRPEPSEYGAFYAGYVSLVPEPDIVPVLEQQRGDVQAFALTVAPDRQTFAYAPGKWTIRQVLGHVTDAERVFGYRAFAINRGEKASLPGFEENEYAAQSDAADRPVEDLADEFVLARDANLSVLGRVAGDAWLTCGTVNATTASVRALAYIMAGHVRHHLRILHQLYGIGSGA